jgi:SepF-like predicted cell division protein (DUF552 family)
MKLKKYQKNVDILNVEKRLEKQKIVRQIKRLRNTFGFDIIMWLII